MKTMTKILLCLVMVLMVCISIVACDKDDTPGSLSTETKNETKAETMNETEATTETVAATESETTIETETLAETKAETKPATEPVTEPVTVPATEPATEPTTEPVTEPVTETIPETIPETLPETEAATKPDNSPQFEKDAIAALAGATQATVNSSINQDIKILIDETIGYYTVLSQEINTQQGINNGNVFSNQTTTSTDYMQDPAQVTTENIHVTQVKTENGYNFYMPTSYAGNTLYILITATEDEIDEANAALANVQMEIQFSIGDFENVVTTTAEDGSTVYTCTNIIPGAMKAYEQLVADMLGMASLDSTVKIDEDTVEYRLTMKDGKITATRFALTYEINAEDIPMAVDQIVEATYTYNCEEITAPADWNYDATTEFTWKKYWELLS